MHCVMFMLYASQYNIKYIHLMVYNYINISQDSKKTNRTVYPVIVLFEGSKGLVYIEVFYKN